MSPRSECRDSWGSFSVWSWLSGQACFEAIRTLFCIVQLRWCIVGTAARRSTRSIGTALTWVQINNQPTLLLPVNYQKLRYIGMLRNENIWNMHHTCGATLRCYTRTKYKNMESFYVTLSFLYISDSWSLSVSFYS